MNYCARCGAAVGRRVPPGDDRPRDVCVACGTIYYQNPKIVAGCVPQWEDEILLCRRAIEPRAGLWTLPAGFMENGETATEAAARETLEEANAHVRMGRLFTHLSIPRISHVYVMFLADLTERRFSAGAESLEVALFPEARIPWDEIAFPSIQRTLELYFQDRERGRFDTHVADIHRRP